MKVNKYMIFPFRERKSTVALTCTHVMIDEQPIVYASHDEDGLWQFLCGNEDDGEDDALVLTLGELFDRDKSIGKLADIPCGNFATRSSPDDEWQIFSAIDLGVEGL